MKRLIYCGAHVGESLAKIIDGFTIADVFEANPYLVMHLENRFATKKHLAVHHLAVGDYDHTATFHVYGNDAGSGSLSTINPAAVDVVSHRWGPGHFDEKQSFEVEVVNLYRWCSRRGIHEIDTLVLDVQGMDATVIETMEPLLHLGRIRSVQLEVDADSLPHYVGGPDNSFDRVQRFFRTLPDYVQVAGPTRSWAPDEDHMQADLVFERV